MLCGCELIAGIQDLQEGTPADADSGVIAKDAASYTGHDTGSPPADARSIDSPPAVVDAHATDAAFDAGIADTSVADTTAMSDVTTTIPEASVDVTVPPDSATIVDAAPDTTTTPEAGPSVLIDDMESVGVPNGWLDGPNMNGTWYVFDDGTDGGVLTPAQGSAASKVISVITPSARGTSVHAAHVTGNAGFTVYGGGMGFNMNSPTGTTMPYDASAYIGFTFYARALGDAATTKVTFNVLDAETALSGSGGDCDGGPWCSGYYQITLNLTNSWQQFTIFYSDLQRPTWARGLGPALDAAHMLGCQFQANQGYAFDLWVDDISFVEP